MVSSNKLCAIIFLLSLLAHSAFPCCQYPKTPGTVPNPVPTPPIPVPTPPIPVPTPPVVPARPPPTPTPPIPVPTPPIPVPTPPGFQTPPGFPGPPNPYYGHPIPEEEYCPRDALKFGVCADILGLVNIVIGSPISEKCCALLDGLLALEAAVCLCTAINANVLGIIHLEIPVALSLILSACHYEIPPGFQCPPEY